MYLSPDVDKVVENRLNTPIWESLKSHLKSRMSQINYNNWLKPIEKVLLEDGVLTITVPNKFTADWITDYYIELIEKEASIFANHPVKIRFEILIEQEFEKKEVKTGNGSQNLGQNETIQTRPQPIVRTSHPLNPKYTFESFVVGSGNQLAHAAAKAVADFPGGHYNPLFLYGGVGLGKTHLLNAVGLALLKKHPEIKIIYISSEKFMNEFINSVRNDKMGEFRKKYRENCDMLLIDDIQFLGGKESTQDEFFHTFNALHDSQRQIIVTSDKVPKEIPGLEDRLRSRFEWGLIADIQAPDLETRVAILRKKAEKDKINLTDDVAMFLAREVRSNVRELEGALIRLNAFASLKQQKITLDLAQEILKNIFKEKGPNQQRTCTIENIQKVVAEYYQIRIEDLKSPRRQRSFAHPRQVAMFLCKKHLKTSFPEIGSKFGGKDHTTVMYAVRKIETLLEQDPNLQNDLSILEKTILH